MVCELKRARTFLFVSSSRRRRASLPNLPAQFYPKPTHDIILTINRFLLEAPLFPLCLFLSRLRLIPVLLILPPLLIHLPSNGSLINQPIPPNPPLPHTLSPILLPPLFLNPCPLPLPPLVRIHLPHVFYPPKQTKPFIIHPFQAHKFFSLEHLMHTPTFKPRRLTEEFVVAYWVCDLD